MTEIYMVMLETYDVGCGTFSKPIKCFHDETAANCFVIDMEKRSKEYRDKLNAIMVEERKLKEPLVEKIRAGEIVIDDLKKATLVMMDKRNALNAEYPDHEDLALDGEDDEYTITVLELE